MKNIYKYYDHIYVGNNLQYVSYQRTKLQTYYFSQ